MLIDLLQERDVVEIPRNESSNSNSLAVVFHEIHGWREQWRLYHQLPKRLIVFVGSLLSPIGTKEKLKTSV